MEKNEISKLLYKQNPIAGLLHIRKGYAYYEATVEEVERGSLYVQFEVPVSEMGDADFFPQMEAKFLRRWILK